MNARDAIRDIVINKISTLVDNKDYIDKLILLSIELKKEGIKNIIYQGWYIDITTGTIKSCLFMIIKEVDTRDIYVDLRDTVSVSYTLRKNVFKRKPNMWKVRKYMSSIENIS